MFPSSEQWLFLANSYLSKFFGIKGKSDAEKIKTILVVKLDEIGDMATATHVFKLLKRNYPDSKITLLCKSFNRSLMKNDPNIDEIITNTDEFNKRFDIVVELRGTWKTFFKSILHPPKYRVDRGTVRLRNRGNQLHEVDTNFEIIKPLLE
ncbi:MAG: hypothetical protein H7321_01190, partial [Bacteroidia bacterium]|nr:hypothetical protein [Bacteroidia bacterium]